MPLPAAHLLSFCRSEEMCENSEKKIQYDNSKCLFAVVSNSFQVSRNKKHSQDQEATQEHKISELVEEVADKRN